MCLIAFHWAPDEDQYLILTANRDEFFHRKALPIQAWLEHPTLYAGKDLSQGGTWLGITQTGRFAALTNHRDMRRKGPESAKSRGFLTLDFLTGDDSPEHYAHRLAPSADEFSGFNLLVGDRQQLVYFNNVDGHAPKTLRPGIYGLSNA